jgi:hypothetical protein
MCRASLSALSVMIFGDEVDQRLGGREQVQGTELAPVTSGVMSGSRGGIRGLDFALKLE